MTPISHIKKLTILAGGIMIVFGFVFLLQSQGTLGPESSFMYANPQWDTNGKVIIIMGVCLCIVGIIVQIVTKTHRKDTLR